ncbi:MAG: hypothetical protein K2P51_04285 [Rhabdochlamydiaceae bacterium]|nr:hypothetical protein [Rhabdochlamydiaceae bacterium]
MNFKLIGSLLLLAIGTYLVLHGLTAAPPVETSKDIWQKTSDFFTNNPMWNPLIEFFGGSPIVEKPLKRDYSSIINISVGSALILAGIALAFLCCKKKFRK